MAMDKLEMTAMILAIVGSVNWGLTAFGYNVVNLVFGGFFGGILETIVYVLIALSGLYLIYYMKNQMG